MYINWVVAYNTNYIASSAAHRLQYELRVCAAARHVPQAPSQSVCALSPWVFVESTHRQQSVCLYCLFVSRWYAPMTQAAEEGIGQQREKRSRGRKRDAEILHEYKWNR